MMLGSISINLLQEFLYIYLEFFIHALFGNSIMYKYIYF